jgi:DNA-binding NtrC family response regulator
MGAKRVLVVDDDRGIIELLKAGFTSKGYAVTTASTGTDGMETLKKEQFDLLVFDVHLPGANGLELLAASRKLGRNTPVVMMSGMATDVTKRTASYLGGIAFLDKPFKLDAMMSTAEQAMASASGPKRDRSILVADDHEGTREAIAGILELGGYDVAVACDGSDVMQKIKTAPKPFDFAMLDLHMPGLCGPERIQHVSKASPKTLVVFVTGEATSDEVAQAYEKGGATLIRKPFRADRLVAVFIDLENQAAEKRQEAEKQEMFDHLPAHRKAVEVAREIAKAPPSSRAKRILHAVIYGILVLILAIMAVVIAAKIETAVKHQKGKIEEMLEKMQEYARRGESLERERQDMEQERKGR